MACSKNTFPINLVNTTNACDITCSLSFNYNNSANFKVSYNNLSYINLVYKQARSPRVNFCFTKTFW